MSRDNGPDIAIDFVGHTIEIFGQVYSLELFRVMAFAPLGSVVRIIERDKVVTLQELRAEDCSPNTCQLRESNSC